VPGVANTDRKTITRLCGVRRLGAMKDLARLRAARPRSVAVGGAQASVTTHGEGGSRARDRSAPHGRIICEQSAESAGLSAYRSARRRGAGRDAPVQQLVGRQMR